MANAALTVSLQQNLITLLACDSDSCMLIRNAVDPDLFASTVYREVVIRIYTFLDQFKKPPGIEHLPDLVEDVLTGTDEAKATSYADLIADIDRLRQGINKEYVLNQLEGFVRRQKLVQGVIEAYEQIEAGELEQAEVTLESALRQRLSLFQPGITLKQGLELISAVDDVYQDMVLINIPELDRRRLGPARKQLSLVIAPAKRGKSWWMIHVGKQALLQRWKVLHITLEMSEEQTVQRYLQALFSLTRRVVQNLMVTTFDKNDIGRLLNIQSIQVPQRASMSDAATLANVRKKLDKLRVSDNLIVKQFPTGALTINQLKAYMDSLERMHNFVPDILILDYADLMYVNPQFYRHELGKIYVDLRGLGVERNIAVTTASQSNREGANNRLVQETNVAEDWSKIATADLIMTYSQTKEEKLLGLARLFVANARNDEDRFAILMSQAYALGQFCLDSVFMSDSYWGIIDEKAKPHARDTEEES